VIGHLEETQRLFNLTRSYDEQQVLRSTGLNSSLAVARLGQGAFLQKMSGTVASESWLELMLRDLQKHQNIDLSSKVNWLIDELGGERLPSINLAYVDLS